MAGGNLSDPCPSDFPVLLGCAHRFDEAVVVLLMRGWWDWKSWCSGVLKFAPEIGLKIRLTPPRSAALWCLLSICFEVLEAVHDGNIKFLFPGYQLGNNRLFQGASGNRGNFYAWMLNWWRNRTSLVLWSLDNLTKRIRQCSKSALSLSEIVVTSSAETLTCRPSMKSVFSIIFVSFIHHLIIGSTHIQPRETN